MCSLAAGSQLNVPIKVAGYDTSISHRYTYLCQSDRRQDKKARLFNYQEFCMVVRTKNIINCTPYDLEEEVVVVVVSRDY
jgi:hypothetical protein